MRLRMMAAVVALGCMTVGSGGAGASNPPEPIRLVPVDGAHWQAKAGLPDRQGMASQALVLDIGEQAPPEPIHVGVASLRGYVGQPTSALDVVGFAVTQRPGWIIPCIRIAFTDVEGRAGEVMLHAGSRRDEGVTWTEARTGEWTTYATSPQLPEGTLTAIELQVEVLDVGEQGPPDPVRVAFDNVQVGTKVWTSAADNGG